MLAGTMLFNVSGIPVLAEENVSVEVSTEAVTEAVTEAAAPAPQAAPEAVPQPAAETAPQPVTEAATEPATEAPQPVTEAVTEPVTEAPQPVTEAATEPVTEAATEPVTEAATEPVTEAATEAATEPTTEVATEAATEPMTEAVTEPATEAETEAATEAETETETEKSFEEYDMVIVPEDGSDFAAVYEAADENTKVLAQAAKGSQVRVVGEEEEWALVVLGELKGYVKLSNLKEEMETENAVPRSMYLVSDVPENAQMGDVITLHCITNGYEEESYTLQWQYRETDWFGNFVGEWTDAAGETDSELAIVIDEESVLCAWRVVLKENDK